MQIQKSYSDSVNEAGKLYVVPTPIGNLEDITYRAINILNYVDIIAAEDTRHTRKLLSHYDIHTPLISYHEHSDKSREHHIIDRLNQGESIALVSDAGMPGISDPGYDLVNAAIANELSVVVLPGANAGICALVGSGLQTKEFLFYGFLPRKKKTKEAEINRLKQMKSTLIFYESPYRIKETLNFFYKELGNRRIVIAREITKRYEEYVRGSLEDLTSWASERTFKGEFCLIVSGNDKDDLNTNQSLWWSHLSIVEHVRYYEESETLKTNEAIKRVAKEREMNRRDIYKIVHVDD